MKFCGSGVVLRVVDEILLIFENIFLENYYIGK